MDCKESRELLALSVDGELDARSETTLAEHLAGCAACAGQRQVLAGLARGVRTAASYHPAPAGLRARIVESLPAVTIHEPASRSRYGWRLFGGAGLAAAAVAALVMIAVLPLAPSAERRLDEELMASHARALLSEHVIDIASSDQHTVKPWLSARLDFSAPVRDLGEQGFPLAGGRLDYVDGRPAAVLVYHRRQHVIEVFVQSAEGSATMALQTIEGYHIVGWTAQGLRLRALSDVDATELQRLADLLRQ